MLHSRIKILLFVFDVLFLTKELLSIDWCYCVVFVDLKIKGPKADGVPCRARGWAFVGVGVPNCSCLSRLLLRKSIYPFYEIFSYRFGDITIDVTYSRLLKKYKDFVKEVTLVRLLIMQAGERHGPMLFHIPTHVERFVEVTSSSVFSFLFIFFWCHLN